MMVEYKFDFNRLKSILGFILFLCFSISKPAEIQTQSRLNKTHLIRLVVGLAIVFSIKKSKLNNKQKMGIGIGVGVSAISYFVIKKLVALLSAMSPGKRLLTVLLLLLGEFYFCDFYLSHKQIAERMQRDWQAIGDWQNSDEGRAALRASTEVGGSFDPAIGRQIDRALQAEETERLELVESNEKNLSRKIKLNFYGFCSKPEFKGKVTLDFVRGPTFRVSIVQEDIADELANKEVFVTPENVRIFVDSKELASDEDFNPMEFNRRDLRFVLKLTPWQKQLIDQIKTLNQKIKEQNREYLRLDRYHYTYPTRVSMVSGALDSFKRQLDGLSEDANRNIPVFFENLVTQALTE